MYQHLRFEFRRKHLWRSCSATYTFVTHVTVYSFANIRIVNSFVSIFQLKNPLLGMNASTCSSLKKLILTPFVAEEYRWKTLLQLILAHSDHV